MTQTVNLKLRQGEDGGFTFRILDGGAALDLTGARAKLQVRKTARSTGTPVLALTHTGGITLNGTLGSVRITGHDTRTTEPGTYEYDLFVELAGRTHVPVAGRLDIQDAVTDLTDWT